MSDVNLDQDAAIEYAEDHGFRVYRGGARKILLDLDDQSAIDTYRDRLIKVTEIFSSDSVSTEVTVTFVEKRRWVSKSGRGLHIVLEASRPLKVRERLIIQLIFGSDPIKELYSLLRIWQGVKEPSLLFRPPKGMAEAAKAAISKKKSSFSPSWEFDDDVPF
jgi:hypothetical protein